MINIPQSNDYVPKSWKGAMMNGIRKATFVCPNGHQSSISKHTIADDGTVKPSVVCAYEGCTFHEHIKLVGWNDKIN